jgi:hypothetical protein
MKKVLINGRLLALVLLYQVATLALAQEGHPAFLQQFQEFVLRFEGSQATSTEQLAAADSIYSHYNHLYATQYKAEMDNSEKKEFSEYKSRYKKTRLKYKVDKLTNKVDTIGNKVGNKIEEKGSEVIGTIKGWFKK